MGKIILINPIGMEFEEWIAQMSVNFPFVIIPLPTREENWRECISALMVFQELGLLANPYSFDSWREWALTINSPNN